MSTAVVDVSESAVPEAELSVGPQAIAAYARLSYTMWHALAEFIDNSTQSRENYASIIDPVLETEGTPLVVKIDHSRLKRTITIEDNSIGMSGTTLRQALKIANPTADSKGRSKYGMGMKTAACWIGKRWTIVTTEYGSKEEWTAIVDVDAIAFKGAKVPLTPREVLAEDHYTKIIIEDLNRNIQLRTEDTIKGYLGSMYRYDIEKGRLKILYNENEVKPPEDYDLDTDPDGKPMLTELPEKLIGGKKVTGWFGVMRKGGRKFGGFSLFQNERQIQGFPNAWKPATIYGGVEDEGANNLVAQRLIGVLNLDGFAVSHTKDAILFANDEEEELEKWLCDETKHYRNYASKRRGPKAGWSRDKVKDLIASMKSEFTSPEMKDAVNTSFLPPLDAIEASNQKQLETLDAEDSVGTVSVSPELQVVVSLVEKSEYEPHATLVAGASQGTIHVIINGLHPYYASLESSEAIEECLKQYIYEAIAEYRVSQLAGRVNPDTARRYKDGLLRVNELHANNVASAVQDGKFETKLGS